MEKLLNTFIKNLKETFDERLSSVFLYGSCAVEDCSTYFPDINLIVIIKNLCAQDLKKAHRFSKTFAKKAKYLPIFMDREEWFSSGDVYAIEYADIKERNKILYGENLIEAVKVDKKELRLQCEQEVKNLLIRLRQNYLGNEPDKKLIKNLILASSKTFTVIFRATLRLLNENIPKNNDDTIKLFAEKIKTQKIDFDENLFLKILKFKNKQINIKDEEIDNIMQKLIDSTNSVLKYVDKLKV